MDSTSVSHLASTVGIISTTAFWSMNFTINHNLFPTILLGGIPKSSTPSGEISSKSRVPSTSEPRATRPFLNRQWQEMYWRAHRWGQGSAILSSVAFASASYLQETVSRKKGLYAAAALAAVSVIPWTLLVIMPTNDELHRRADAQVTAAMEEKESEVPKGDGRDILDLIKFWVSCNNTRASLALIATVAGVAASML